MSEPDNPRDDTSRPDRAAQIAAARATLEAAGDDDTRPGKASRSGLTTYRWSRWLHVYTSMIAFLVILFFGITGVTLNHPSWTFGDETDTVTVEGTLSADALNDDGSVNYLGISEEIRAEHSVGAPVESFNATGSEATIGYRAPGYEADVIVDTETGEYSLTTTQVGWVGVANDLHKGRYADTSWRWVIDVAGIFLVAVSITGVVMQFYLRKRRTSAYVTAVAGGVLVLILAWITLH